MKGTSRVGEPMPSPLPALAASLTLGVSLPTVLVKRFGGSLSSVVAGALTWGAALLVKRVTAPLIGRLGARRSPVLVASAQGLVSALAELGVAEAYLTRRSAMTPPRELLSFGSGAAGVEALALIAIGALAEPVPEDRVQAWAEGARRSRAVRHAFFVERLSASLGHVASRFLTHEGIRRRQPSMIAAPVLLFVAVDGVASYGHNANWDWSDPAVARRFDTFLAAVGALELFQLVVAARRVSGASSVRDR